MSQPRIIIGKANGTFGAVDITAPVVKQIAPHSLVNFRWALSEDKQSYVLQQRIASNSWSEVPFFRPS